MADQDNPTSNKPPELGKLLRDRRAHHGWTLADVSSMTGISTSTLSKIENGLLSPTFDKVLQLSRGLGVEIADLLEPPATEAAVPAIVVARRSVSRNFEGQQLQTKYYTYRYLCSDVAHKRIIPIHVEVRATTLEQAEMSSHVGEEFVQVLKGRIMLHTEYYEPTQLNAGDCVYLDSTMKHAYISLTKSPSEIMITCSSATPNLAQTLREIIKEKIVTESKGS
ncbi:helix-turn-helix domain-containing protein [Ancylobacter sp.]|uniref:helix-turn-helix domain-containing protein n=1 Tax=Ancylobacter sp. TaxID=1872567 RepID=UPI003D13DC33